MTNEPRKPVLGRPPVDGTDEELDGGLRVSSTGFLALRRREMTDEYLEEGDGVPLSGRLLGRLLRRLRGLGNLRWCRGFPAR